MINLHLTVENKSLIIRRALFALLLIVSAVLQGTDGLFPTPFGLRAFLLIPAVVSIAMFEREVVGLLFGAFAGALWDTYTMGIGFNAFFLTCIAFGSGVLIHYLMRNNLSTAALICSVSLLLYVLLYWLWNYAFKGYGTAWNVLITFYLPSCLYSLIFTPLMYIIVRTLMKKFR